MKKFEHIMKEANYWIRFELGLDYAGYNTEKYFKELRKRAETIYRTLFDENDLVAVTVRLNEVSNSKEKRLPRIARFLRNKKEVNRLKYKKIPYVYDPEEKEMVTHQYSLVTRAKNIRTSYLIEALGNKNYKRSPTVEGSVYLVSLSKKIVFHMYDERGCDITSMESQKIYPLYLMFRPWILDYDRIEIDQLFKDGLFEVEETNEENEQRGQLNEQKIKEMNINLFETNTCMITHKLIIPNELKKDCIKEMRQTGFKITSDEKYIFATKTEALALIDYQTELMALYAKKYKGKYEFWEAKRAF